MALNFNGTTDQVTHGDTQSIDQASAITIALWYNPDLNTGSHGMVFKFSGTAHAITVAQISDTVRVLHTDGGQTATTPLAALKIGVWAHVACVFDGAGTGNAGRQKIYINGADQSLTFVGTIPATLGDGGTEPLSTMGNVGGSMAFGDGKLGLLKIWISPLTAAGVAQEMNSYRPVRRANLLLWAPYDDGLRARDYSGSGNHGTVTGALNTGGPPQIPRTERPLRLWKRRADPGLWGHRVLP